ncbi:hypothetical protein EK21DRAFT_115930 [Setomelanomma holmii]|uniref:Uncharacterized protein n=1 Tax=Setomelanomma holmii TaxID=210430 RepID=A0A9P4H2H1_9PLEO|nr:hypothetical protein EK21DRAFT_115930 [Setomelanomma holmii]
MSSTSSQRVFTPPSTTPTSAVGRLSTPSSRFEDRSEADQVFPNLSRTTSGTPQFTPSSTPSDANQNQYNPDPDIPLPSVERDVSSTTDRRSTPSTVHYTPSLSSDSHSTEQAGGHDTVFQEIGNIRASRLTSPDTGSIPQRASRTPSIHVTPSAPPNDTSQSRSSRDFSITTGSAALRMEDHRADSLSTAGLRESSSPSPSRRRRSGSGIRRERHQVEAEDPPEAFAHMAEVQEALADARTLTRRIATVLSSSSLHHENGSSIQNLHQQATRLENFQLPSSRIVGLVGDSGVGKSSLINSLLDKSDLARASSSGTACTCAVTEYHFHERDDFIVHVDYFPMGELKKQFEELLSAHRDFQLLPNHHRDRNEDDVNDNGKLRLRKKAKLAMETFRTSFGERLHEMPGILSSTPFEHAVATMVEWASQLLPQQAERNIFSTIEDCASWLGQLSSETDSSLPSGNVRTSWPFIQKVRVYLKAYILSKGLIIADLPGLRDLNSTRQAITEHYVRQCHQIFVVARIDRAITDESIKQICELACCVNLSKVDFVCTRSAEDIQTREAIHDWRTERATIEDMQNEIAVDEDEMQSLQEKIDDYDQDVASLTREEARQLLELQRDYRKVEKAKKSHDWDLKRFIVGLRNDKVSRRLREEYRNHPIATSLGIFCVSNKIYWDNREKAPDIALPYLRLSGILELRCYCIGVVAQSRLQATQTFIKDEIPAFIGSVELWVESGSGNASAESKQRVLDDVSAIQQELDKLMSPVSRLNHISRTLETEFNSQIYMRMRRDGPHWSAHAREASLSWEEWNPSSYKAFCSNYGDYSTPVMGSRCWNEEAIQGMTTDLSAVWDSFAVDLDTGIERVNTAAVHIYAKVFEIAASPAENRSRETDDIGSAMRTLASNLLHREHLTRYGIEKVTETFESNLSSLRSDTLSSVRTALIGKLMEGTYHAANMDYGNDSRRKTRVTGRFSSPALFEAHRRECRDKFRELARELQEQMIEVMDEQGERVKADLQLLRDGNAISESERDVGFKKRVSEEMRSVKEEVARLGRVVS